jgi:hypothetical protein
MECADKSSSFCGQNVKAEALAFGTYRVKIVLMYRAAWSSAISGRIQNNVIKQPQHPHPGLHGSESSPEKRLRRF